MVNQVDNSAEEARRKAIAEGMRRARSERETASRKADKGLADLRRAIRDDASASELLTRIELIQTQMRKARWG